MTTTPVSKRTPTTREFTCPSCGARLQFDPRTAALSCRYCGGSVPVVAARASIPDIDLEEGRRIEREAPPPAAAGRLLHCGSCGADATPAPDVTAGRCPFCGGPFVLHGASGRPLRPAGVLPFRVPRAHAEGAFRAWVASRWFAPSGLARLARATGTLAGVYLPAFLFDCRTTTAYRGERGDHYWATERRNGQTRPVRRTRWQPAAGVVRVDVDDLAVVASDALPGAFLDALEPWDIPQLVPYRDEYLSGFMAQEYQGDLDGAYARAQDAMQEGIDARIREHIGGDQQRITSKETRYDAVRFRAVLLPAWISAYRFRERVFRFVVNGRTGEVQGERPWSAVKIGLALLLGLALLALAAFAGLLDGGQGG